MFPLEEFRLTMRNTIATLAAAGLTLAAAAHAQGNSRFTRGEFQPTGTPALQTLTGWYTWRQVAPRDHSPGSAGLVASPRLLYTVHADLDANLDVTIHVDKSVDGGRSWAGSRPIHTVDTAGGALLNSEYETVLDVFAWGSSVYVLWMSNEHDPRGTDQGVWVIGSDDQGATWSAPALVSTGVGSAYADSNEATAVCTDRGLYVAWLGDHVSGKPVAGSPASGWAGNAAEFDGDYVEDVFFSHVAVAGGLINIVVAETDLTGYGGNFNCDWLQMDGVGDVVHVVWSDDAEPGLPAGPQDRVVRSATSIDGGRTFSRQVHTPLYGGRYDRRWYRGEAGVDVFQGTVYVYSFAEDDRNGDGDDVYMDRAQLQRGQLVWTDLGINCTNLVGETEGYRADVEDGLIQIATIDYTVGNIYAIYDRSAGADFIAGNASSHIVRSGDYPNWDWAIPINNYFHDAAVNAGHAGFVFEDCRPQDINLVYTTDRGQTAQLSTVTSQGGCGGGPLGLDVDEPFLTITGNADFSLIWLQSQPGGDDRSNGLWTSSTKFPELAYDSITRALTVRRLAPATTDRGDIAVLMLSQGSGGLDVHQTLLPGMVDYGFFVALDADRFFFALWNDPDWMIRPLAAGATGLTWTGIPPLNDLLGRDVFVVAATIDSSVPSNQPGFFRVFTDPVTLR